MLACIYLSADDFGVSANIDKGLKFLGKAAENGVTAYQAILWRLHDVFGRQVPGHPRTKYPGGEGMQLQRVA